MGLKTMEDDVRIAARQKERNAQRSGGVTGEGPQSRPRRFTIPPGFDGSEDGPTEAVEAAPAAHPAVADLSPEYLATRRSGPFVTGPIGEPPVGSHEQTLQLSEDPAVREVATAQLRFFDVVSLTEDDRLLGKHLASQTTQEGDDETDQAGLIATRPIARVLAIDPVGRAFMVCTDNDLTYACVCRDPAIIELIQAWRPGPAAAAS